MASQELGTVLLHMANAVLWKCQDGSLTDNNCWTSFPSVHDTAIIQGQHNITLQENASLSIEQLIASEGASLFLFGTLTFQYVLLQNASFTTHSQSRLVGAGETPTFNATQSQVEIYGDGASNFSLTCDTTLSIRGTSCSLLLPLRDLRLYGSGAGLVDLTRFKANLSSISQNQSLSLDGGNFYFSRETELTVSGQLVLARGATLQSDDISLEDDSLLNVDASSSLSVISMQQTPDAQINFEGNLIFRSLAISSDRNVNVTLPINSADLIINRITLENGRTLIEGHDAVISTLQLNASTLTSDALRVVGTFICDGCTFQSCGQLGCHLSAGKFSLTNSSVDGARVYLTGKNIDVQTSLVMSGASNVTITGETLLRADIEGDGHLSVSSLTLSDTLQILRWSIPSLYVSSLYVTLPLSHPVNLTEISLTVQAIRIDNTSANAGSTTLFSGGRGFECSAWSLGDSSECPAARTFEHHLTDDGDVTVDVDYDFARAVEATVVNGRVRSSTSGYAVTYEGNVCGRKPDGIEITADGKILKGDTTITLSSDDRCRPLEISLRFLYLVDAREIYTESVLTTLPALDLSYPPLDFVWVDLAGNSWEIQWNTSYSLCQRTPQSITILGQLLPFSSPAKISVPMVGDACHVNSTEISVSWYSGFSSTPQSIDLIVPGQAKNCHVITSVSDGTVHASIAQEDRMTVCACGTPLWKASPLQDLLENLPFSPINETIDVPSGDTVYYTVTCHVYEHQEKGSVEVYHREKPKGSVVWLATGSAIVVLASLFVVGVTVFRHIINRALKEIDKVILLCSFSRYNRKPEKVTNAHRTLRFDIGAF
ncbi:hypothetical protein PROFUN_04904 [Planoprotostelium fungivorum]|uniref:Uncharacterized protein n=1 Tax=Planoprotostelium fungivorum TaxID=1890364 RepID=A0A2P6NF72_9EUKA|nr:hypothetical protein PROFUN_04904 [Planoprotostelium fungivorum]